MLQNREFKCSFTGPWEVLPVTEDEEVWIGLKRYKNIEYGKEVTKAVDAEPEIDRPHGRVVQLVSPASRIVHREF